ncbi:pyrroline-5-carboxylate reductase [Paludibacterium purpuratum]|uniref:Pyrroline-5-carboxylate reductase n=1 Tax=Paludibacterium purpuratum TaxID=1144873 RepID=A0A4V3DUE7_9NEIS|nr:pyrroline-5-carboxylate reductase [Paludibacterium purpuratum]TDR72467.1 pyrroline-5-carboxylate reductase [Paludibacterium purpuratum]
MQITFIGGGNMAAAIIAGLSKHPEHTIRVLDRNQDKLDRLNQQYGAQGLTAMPAQFSPQEVVVLAVKPQQLKALCHDLAPRLGGALTISIAAGIRCDALARWLGSERLVRAMPNTPSMVGKGISGLFAAPAVSPADLAAAEIVMASVGSVVWLEREVGIDDITCVSGSGPAYVFYFIESMMQAARDVGFDEATARQLVLDTFDGAVTLARQSPLPVEQLRSNVTSKGGTTERAIVRFDQEGVKAAIVAGAMDCRARSIEMGQQLSQD